jgi:hypothetical protein
MAGGWTRDGAIQDQIDDTVADAVLAARASIPSGESEPFCAILATIFQRVAARRYPECVLA